MARKRMIDPGYWLDEQFGTMSLLAQLMFIGMWNFADDEGLIRYSSTYLRSAIFPYRDVPIEEIDAAKKEIEETYSVLPYTKNDRQEYCWIKNFRKYQTINKPQPSKLPPPSIQSTAYRQAVFGRDGYVCQLCGRETNPQGHPHGTGSNVPSIDHTIPVSEGGTDHPTNLRCACLSCNKARGNDPDTATPPEGAQAPSESSTTAGAGMEQVSSQSGSTTVVGTPNGRERKGREEKRKESARAREEDFDAQESPGGRIAVTWYRRFTKETARLVEPSGKDRKAAVEVCSRLDPGAVERAIETYFTTDLWFNTDKTTKQRRYSFQSFLANITELLSPNARASPEIELTPHCEACGKLLINGECMNLECTEYQPVEYEELQL